MSGHPLGARPIVPDGLGMLRKACRPLPKIKTTTEKRAMRDIKAMKEAARKYIRYEKDKATKIATLTFDRPDAQNATTAGMRQVYADLVFKARSEEHTSELQSLMRISYAVFCLNKKIHRYHNLNT